MGCKNAFDFHKQWLQKKNPNVTDEEVTENYLNHLRPNGIVVEYLSLGKIIIKINNLLFVHGCLDDSNIMYDNL